MGKNKLAKFADMDRFPNVVQFPYAKIAGKEPFEHKGKWRELFGNDNPIVLELGCGRGEYAVGLGRMFKDRNFVGMDIKGARMWTGARQALDEGLGNVFFLRGDIEFLDYFFEAGEVSEIWITFPDPQMKKTRKRLTSTRFMQLYLKVMKKGGTVHLKTDSPFLYEYTTLMAEKNGFGIADSSTDILSTHSDDAVLCIKTTYEKQWMERGLPIRYVAMIPEPRQEYVEPEENIEYDSYRSYNRSRRGNSNPQ